MFKWSLIAILFGLGWWLGRPEISAFVRRLSRRNRWVGALTPSPAPVKLYEDHRDLQRLNSRVEVSPILLKHFEESHRRASLQFDCALPELDPRLCHIALWIAESLMRGQSAPQASYIRYLNTHFGNSAPIPFILHLRQSELEDNSGIIFKYEESLIEALKLGAPKLLIGFAERHFEGERITVALIQPRYLSLNPFSSHVVGDMGLIIHGESIDMLPLEAWLTRPDGSAQSLPLQRNGSYFSLQLKDRERGLYQVELIGETSRGPAVCLNTLIYRSVMPPQEFILTESAKPSRLAWVNRRRLYTLINDSRRLVGQASLPKSRALQSIAQQYAQEMSQYGFASHTSPKGESLSHRALKLKDRAERIFENLAVGSTVEELHEQLMASPAHRAAVLDSEVTHVGVGLCAKDHLIFGVEVFSLMNRALKLAEDRPELYRVIQRYRRDEGLGRLPHDETLERAALSVARALVNGDCKLYEVNQHAQHNLEQDSNELTIGVIEVYVCQVNRVESLPNSEVWLQDQVKSFGVGLAQGAAHEPYWVVAVMRLQDRGQRQGLNLLVEHS